MFFLFSGPTHARNKVTSELLKESKNDPLPSAVLIKNPSHCCTMEEPHNLLSRKKSDTIKSLIVNEKELVDKMEIADSMNSHFIQAPTPLQDCHQLLASNTYKMAITLEPASEEEITNIVRSLNPNKSSCPSTIDTKCLQLTILSISSSLTRIVNLILHSGSVPPGRKADNVTPAGVQERRQIKPKKL